MSPHFKALLIATFITLLVVMGCRTAYAEEATFKLCFAAAKLETGEIGCYNGVKAVGFQDWLTKIDPRLGFDRAEILSASVVKVYFKQRGRTK